MVTICSILFLGGWYTGIPKISSSPPAPNFAIRVGLVTTPPSSSHLELHSEEWFLRGVERWPAATFHQIDDKNGACAAHAEEGPMILYKTTVKAHITGFRMVNFIQPDSFHPGWPQTPVLRRLSAEFEKDCGNAYDLVIFPFGVLSRASFY